MATRRRLPKQSKGKPWSLRVVPRLRVKGEDCWGVCDYGAKEIVLTKAAEKHGVDRQVFLHEMLHKIMPWLDEEAVDDAATELDDALDVAGM